MHRCFTWRLYTANAAVEKNPQWHAVVLSAVNAVKPNVVTKKDLVKIRSRSTGSPESHPGTRPDENMLPGFFAISQVFTIPSRSKTMVDCGCCLRYNAEGVASSEVMLGVQQELSMMTAWQLLKMPATARHQRFLNAFVKSCLGQYILIQTTMTCALEPAVPTNQCPTSVGIKLLIHALSAPDAALTHCKTDRCSLTFV